MRLLGIDLGDRRTGLAVADSAMPIAAPLPTLERKSGKEDIVEPLRKVCEDQRIDRIVIGVPRNMDGSIGPQAQISLDLAKKLRTELGIEVVTSDERLTSQMADRAMLQGDLSRKKRKKRVDQIAAQLILQNYLDAHPGL